MFGKTKSKFQSETTAFNPQSPYGTAKVFAHLITQVQFHRGSVMVHSKILLSEGQRLEVQNKINKFEVLFRT